MKSTDFKSRSNKSSIHDGLPSIHYFEFGDGFEDALEAHEPWELVYVDRGSCGIVADDRSFVLNQGEMYFHKPFEQHMLKVVKGIAPNIFIVTFSSTSPAMRFFENRRLTASLETKQQISAILHEASSTFDLPFNDPRMGTLRLREDEGLWGGEQTVLARLELMLVEIIRNNRHYPTKPKHFLSKEIVDDEFALRIIRFMEERLYGRFTMEELARELAFGKTYISQYFSRVCGYSVLDYFNMMKINEAKRLIRESGHNFFEISEMLMFSNSHYFSTVFKKYTGMTPTQYKKSCKIN